MGKINTNTGNINNSNSNGYADGLYIQKNWKTDPSKDKTLKEVMETDLPVLNYMDGNPYIFAKDKKDKSDTFLKMKFPLQGGLEAEYDISYNNGSDKQCEDEDILSEGDIIDPETLRFRTETTMSFKDGKLELAIHKYVTGDVIG